MKVVKAPDSYDLTVKPIIFLGGSIEMNTAEMWQDRMCNMLYKLDGLLLNPRRDDWASSWIQSFENKQFNEQVTWELEALETCNVAIFYFDPNTKSPITLLELGLFRRKAMVCCPNGYWRKGNVDIVCNRYNIPQWSDLESMSSYIVKHYGS